MRIRRNFVLASVGICLLAAGGCRTVVNRVYVVRQPSPAPAYVHPHAMHRYRYYPQEQVYFDPVRRVYFYLDGTNWRMSASLPGHLRVRNSHFVTIEMEQDRPYLEYKKHRTQYPRHRNHAARRVPPKKEIHRPSPPAHAPAYGYRAPHRYRYYPKEQVYFDPDRRVYFYQKGSRWRMSSSLPAHLQVGHSPFVTVESKQDKPYLEFKNHKAKYPKNRVHPARGGQPKAVTARRDLPAPASTHGNHSGVDRGHDARGGQPKEAAARRDFPASASTHGNHSGVDRGRDVRGGQPKEVAARHGLPEAPTKGGGSVVGRDHDVRGGQPKEAAARHGLPAPAPTKGGRSTVGRVLAARGGHPEARSSKSGKAAPAPTHRKRTDHQYRYYPQQQVYFDPGRKVFFYRNGSNWRMSASLPAHLQVRNSSFVNIKTKQEKPYLEFKKHEAKYPKQTRKEKKEKKRGRSGRHS
jgi:hypothetical protein